MITMEPTMDPIEDLSQRWGPDDLLGPEDAAKYLAWRWKRKSFTVGGFRALKKRLGLKPAIERPNLTLWRRSQLDEIKEPERKGRWFQKEVDNVMSTVYNDSDTDI